MAKNCATQGGTYDGPPLELTLASGSVYPLKGRVAFANNQVDVKTGTASGWIR